MGMDTHLGGRRGAPGSLWMSRCDAKFAILNEGAYLGGGGKCEENAGKK